MRAPHARSTGGGRAGRRPRAAWRTACLRIVRAYPHCSGKSCHSSMPSSSAASYSSGRRDVAVDAQQVEPGVAGQLDVARAARRRRLAQRHAGRGQVGALDEHPLAVDREDPVLQRPPRAARCARLAASLITSSTATSTVDVGQRLVAERPRPPQLRVVDVEGPVDLVEPAGQRLLVLVELRSPSTGCEHVTVRGHVAVEPGAQPQVGAGRRWRRGTARASGRCAPARWCSIRTGRHRPPGFHVGSSSPSAGTRR